MEDAGGDGGVVDPVEITRPSRTRIRMPNLVALHQAASVKRTYGRRRGQNFSEAWAPPSDAGVAGPLGIHPPPHNLGHFRSA